MGSIQSSTMILCALGNQGASFLSRVLLIKIKQEKQKYFYVKSAQQS